MCYNKVMVGWFGSNERSDQVQIYSTIKTGKQNRVKEINPSTMTEREKLVLNLLATSIYERKGDRK